MSCHKLLEPLIGMMLLVLLLVGCSAPSATPENAAKMWINALIDENTSEVSKLTCSKLPDETTEWTPANNDAMVSLLALRFAVGFNTIDERCPGKSPEEKLVKFDASQLQFTTLSEEGDEAQVKVSGQLMFACATSNVSLDPMEGFPQEQTWQMIKEDEVWKWCGAK